MIWNALEKYRDAGLLVLRLGFGLGFLCYHGWGKLVGGPERWAGVGGSMSSMGIDFGHTFFGFIASLAESLGGLLIALGLFFRPACLLLGITMAVATIRHLETGEGSPAHALKNAFVAFGLLFIGPGRYSVDDFMRRRSSVVPDSPEKNR